jgi:hypothetical protein
MYKILFIIIIICILFVICYNNININNNIYFYNTNKYPKIKLLEDNWVIIQNEIPKFNSKTITIYREQDDWINDKGDKFIQKLENNENWIKSWEKK